jgi:hypothetical protein
MARWEKWRPIEQVYNNIDLLNKKGLYQIRMVDADNKPLPIPRIGGTDLKGIIYIGKSIQLRKRIEAFLRGQHSGGGLYWLAYRRLKTREPYRGHFLQFRVMASTSKNIATKETEMLRRYFRRFCELPPFNSTVQGGK